MTCVGQSCLASDYSIPLFVYNQVNYNFIRGESMSGDGNLMVWGTMLNQGCSLCGLSFIISLENEGCLINAHRLLPVRL